MQRLYPATLAQLILSLIGFALVYFNVWGWVLELVFQPTEYATAGLRFYGAMVGFEQGQLWRMITPTYLHFGWAHIIFNGVCLCLFGSLLEKAKGWLWLTMFCIATGVVANWAQYLVGGPQIFGGISGVIYALAAYYYVYNGLVPKLKIDNFHGVYLSVATVMLALFLLLGLSGLLDYFGIARVANAAHMGGLLFGAIIALLPDQR